MKIREILFFFIYLLTFSTAGAQDEKTETERIAASVSALESAVANLSRFKVTSFIQTQYQYAQWGADNYNFMLPNRLNAVEAAENQGYGRFGIRRGRIKITYEAGLMQAVFQPDITQTGIVIRDAFFTMKHPLFRTNLLRVGIFTRPFGYELSYSPALSESPERSRIFQTLFPDERDVGVMMLLQPPKSSPLKGLKAEGGLFAGNGISSQISNRMDFIGRLSMVQQLVPGVVLGAGVSGYIGGVLQNDESVYVMKDGFFQLREPPMKDNITKYAKRQYFGVDFQMQMSSSFGLTTLKAEYITGEHPFAGGVNAKLTGLRTGPVFMRKLNGGYIVLAQDVCASRFTLVAKIDRFDPNTEIAGNEIAKTTTSSTQIMTGSGDISRTTIGLGLHWHIHPSVRFTAYYEIVKNEITANLKDIKSDSTGKITIYGYENQRKANVLTLRLQYMF